MVEKISKIFVRPYDTSIDAFRCADHESAIRFVYNSNSKNFCLKSALDMYNGGALFRSLKVWTSECVEPERGLPVGAWRAQRAKLQLVARRRNTRRRPHCKIAGGREQRLHGATPTDFFFIFEFFYKPITNS